MTSRLHKKGLLYAYNKINDFLALKSSLKSAKSQWNSNVLITQSRLAN